MRVRVRVGGVRLAMVCHHRRCHHRVFLRRHRRVAALCREEIRCHLDLVLVLVGLKTEIGTVMVIVMLEETGTGTGTATGTGTRAEIETGTWRGTELIRVEGQVTGQLRLLQNGIRTIVRGVVGMTPLEGAETTTGRGILEGTGTGTQGIDVMIMVAGEDGAVMLMMQIVVVVIDGDSLEWKIPNSPIRICIPCLL